MAPNQFDPLYFGTNAIVLYNSKALELDPNYCPNLDLALELIEHAKAVFPDQFTESNEFNHIDQEIFKIYTQFLQNHDDNADVWYHLGLLEYLDAAYDQSLICFNNAVEFNPAIVEGWYYLGLCYYYGKHNYMKAMQSLTHATQIAPNFMDAWISMGNIAFDENRFQDAEQDYMKVIRT